MSKKLHNCTTQQLELLNYICTHYKSFALVTFETYLIVTMFIFQANTRVQEITKKYEDVRTGKNRTNVSYCPQNNRLTNN